MWISFILIVTFDIYSIQYSAKCVSGCVCPAGLVADGKGGCIKEDACPCVHNDATYQPGEQIKMKCNTWYEKWMLVCKVNSIQYSAGWTNLISLYFST